MNNRWIDSNETYITYLASYTWKPCNEPPPLAGLSSTWILREPWSALERKIGTRTSRIFHALAIGYRSEFIFQLFDFYFSTELNGYFTRNSAFYYPKFQSLRWALLQCHTSICILCRDLVCCFAGHHTGIRPACALTEPVSIGRLYKYQACFPPAPASKFLALIASRQPPSSLKDALLKW